MVQCISYGAGVTVSMELPIQCCTNGKQRTDIVSTTVDKALYRTCIGDGDATTEAVCLFSVQYQGFIQDFLLLGGGNFFWNSEIDIKHTFFGCSGGPLKNFFS